MTYAGFLDVQVAAEMCGIPGGYLKTENTHTVVGSVVD